MVHADKPRVGQVSFLDQALWRQLKQAATPQAFARAWLALQCRMISSVERGVVVLEDFESGKFAPAAFWPDEGAASSELGKVAEMALAERRGVVHGIDESESAPAADTFFTAYPFIVEDQLYGVICIELQKAARGQLRSVMRQLRWGTSWIEVLLSRERIKTDKATLEQTTAALDLIGTALEEPRFVAASQAAANELANRLDCVQVSLGFWRRGRTHVAAMSHAAQFGGRMNLVRDIGAAMDEAIDQKSTVMYPPASGGEFRIDRAHAELARNHKAGNILTVPMMVNGEPGGAITFERAPGKTFDSKTIELCDCVTAVLGPLLETKRRDDRWIISKILESFRVQSERLFGPRYLGRKLAALVVTALVTFFYFAKEDYRVTSPAVIEGLVQRVLVAAFDGYLATEHARPGETVKKGAVLATLDDKDLVLERLRWSTTRRQRITEYDRALAAHNRADINIIKAQIEQSKAQIALIDEQIARTKLTAPFDGIIIAGDLSQSIGAAVHRGQELFTIAPLDAYRVILEVEENEINNVEIGQEGALLVSALPEDPLRYRVERITPMSEAKEGRNFFRVEACLIHATPRLRPGMEGIGKTLVDERRLIWIWTHSMMDWVRLQIWKWWP